MADERICRIFELGRQLCGFSQWLGADVQGLQWTHRPSTCVSVLSYTGSMGLLPRAFFQCDSPHRVRNLKGQGLCLPGTCPCFSFQIMHGHRDPGVPPRPTYNNRVGLFPGWVLLRADCASEYTCLKLRGGQMVVVYR